MDISEETKELADTELALRADAGDVNARIRLLELTLADSVRVTHRLTQVVLELDRKIERLTK